MRITLRVFSATRLSGSSKKLTQMLGTRFLVELEAEARAAGESEALEVEDAKAAEDVPKRMGTNPTSNVAAADGRLLTCDEVEGSDSARRAI